MDSGNSGSLQSSSGGGGDDELDAVCGGGDGSSLIYGLQDLGTPPLSSHWCSTTAAALPPAGAGAASASSPPPPLPCHGVPASSSPPAAEQAVAAATAQPAAAATRGSKKRPRASRRAPTTVLTTDTSNFRAMVQEFTGIPAPPFAAGGAPRSRFDHHLFPSRSSSSPAAALPQYLLRPFAHKLHAAYPPPSTSSPAPVPANAAIAASTDATAGDSYQHHLTAAEPSALFGMQDHGGVHSYLSFQSTLGGADLAGGDAKYPLYDDDRRVALSSAAPRMQDSSDLLGVAHGVVVSSEGTHAHHLHPRNGGRGDELLSGLGGGCKGTYSSAPPPAGAPTATTTTVAATAAMGKQGVE